MSELFDNDSSPEVRGLTVVEVIEMVTSYQGWGCPGKKIADAIKTADPDGIYSYIQYTDHKGIELKQPKVWKLKEWMGDYERWKKIKLQSEKERAFRADERDVEKQVSLKLQELMMMDEPKANIIATKIVGTKNVILARRFGIDLTELIEKAEKLKERKD